MTNKNRARPSKVWHIDAAGYLSSLFYSFSHNTDGSESIKLVSRWSHQGKIFFNLNQP